MERPVHFLHEEEKSLDGSIRTVNTLFLRNRECSFTCTMCDLWRDTLESNTPVGAIPAQIQYALDRLPPARQIKLYNSGNFFDRRAIPPSDHADIRRLIEPYEHLIVENHPSLCRSELFEFAASLHGTFEVAMGLETIHPDILPKLNKRLTPRTYREATEKLRTANIFVRTFLLLQLPWEMDPEQNRDWTLRSLDYACRSGSHRVTLIPTRSGNGYMDHLEATGQFVEPGLRHIEKTFSDALEQSGDHALVQLDLWDLNRFSTCPTCFDARLERLQRQNLSGQPEPSIECPDCPGSRS